MAFSYDLTTDVGKVRLDLQDTVAGDGVLPNSANLQDEEIQAILTRENSVEAAVAGCCELLQRAWSRMSASLSTSNRHEAFNQAAQWEKAALAARKRAASGGFASIKLIPPNRIPPIEYP